MIYLKKIKKIEIEDERIKKTILSCHFSNLSKMENHNGFEESTDVKFRHKIYMPISDILILVIRWLHLTSSSAWIGGGIFYILILQPLINKNPQTFKSLKSSTGRAFQSLSNICIIMMIATGAIMGFDRLSESVTNLSYAITLFIKVILSVWIIIQMQMLRRKKMLSQTDEIIVPLPTSRLRKIVNQLTGYNGIVLTGILIFLISDVLGLLFENALR